MVLSWTELLNEINAFFIKITRGIIFDKEPDDFKAHVKKCLRLNSEQDWDYILASEDILEDSNAAISSFLRFGLSGPTKYDDLGEKYLRLYGLLNATYLQQQAILNLYKYFQCPSPSNVKEEIEALAIRELRNKLGSHSADCVDNQSNEIHTFVPVRLTLEDFKCEFFNHINNSNQKVCLKSAIDEHLKLLCGIYYKIVIKSVKTIYKGNKEKAECLIKEANPFHEMLNGAYISKSENGSNIWIIHTVAP